MTARKPTVVSKMPISSSTMGGKGMIIFSLPFIGTGTWIMGMMLGYFPISGKVNASKEVVFVAGLAFFLAGLSVLIQGFSRYHVSLQRMRRKRKSLHSKWIWDYEWNPKGIGQRSQSSFLNHILGLSIVSIFLYITYWIGFIADGGTKIPFYGMCFFIFIILFWGYTFFSRRLRFGKPYLRFSKFPYHVKDRINLVFVNLPASNIVKEVNIYLRFYEEHFVKNSKNQTVVSLNEKYIYFQTISGQSINFNKELSVDIKLPQEISYSNEISESPASFWEIQIECDIKGLDYRQYFLVPIYS